LERVVIFNQPCFFGKHASYSAIELESKKRSSVIVLEQFGDPDENVFLSDEFVRITGRLGGEYYKASVILEIEEEPMPRGFRPSHLVDKYNWEEEYDNVPSH